LRFALLPAFKRYELGKSHRIPRPMAQPLPSKSVQPLFLVLVLVPTMSTSGGFFLIVLVVVVVPSSSVCW
jgi:hypothetical protein